MAIPPLLAKRLRERVVIQTPAPRSQSSDGQMVENWTTHGTFWMAKEPLQGREFMSAQQEQGELKIRFRVRFSTLAGQITTDMRAVHDGKYYNIRSIIHPGERNRHMQLMCTEGVNDG